MVGMELRAGTAGREGELQHRRRAQQQGVGAAVLGLGDHDVAGAAGLDQRGDIRCGEIGQVGHDQQQFARAFLLHARAQRR